MRPSLRRPARSFWKSPLCGADVPVPLAAYTDCCLQADSLTEEQVSEYKEAFSLFVSRRIHPRGIVEHALTWDLFTI